MDSMTTDTWTERQIEVTRKMSLVLPNEFLFCIFYLVQEWKQPISSKKLANDLRAGEKVVRDHLNLLVKLDLATKTGEKYRLSDMGKEAACFIKEAVGKTPLEGSWLSSPDLYSVAILSPSATTPIVNSARAEAGLLSERPMPMPEEQTFDPGETFSDFPRETTHENAA